ncbi:CMGC family protein kinase [Trichomonas vaginalis G3]|uniref:dual-specificity kinase n=1 Tax=Trichomonas vaginalis (strain ATCC PRA-98 / G3) TaxID=412133 RepID=A2G2P9_TRIV3|nr:protein kinase protein [Trichomonas vaginalis G3]EAX88572.1 CMGC family protein kinase [Trichomonas vaginalis G3]KAI5535323.1 protein kinase protein [Trichomonas vaginalis G3]|eukprot:XP_001301502.1 CMGC family protein kinase [Trichomonas vaginalis G3]
MQQEHSNCHLHMKKRINMHRSNSTNALFNNAHTGSGTEIIFCNPVSPEYVLRKYSLNLSEEDREEIKNYNEIYYIHNNSNTKCWMTEDDFIYYNFNKDNHIAFRYQQLQFLGRGSFGTVIKCYDHKLKMNVAIKVLTESDDDNFLINREINFLKILNKEEEKSNSSNILELIDTFRQHGFTFIVTKYFEENLYEYITNQSFSQNLSLHDIKRIAKSVAQALYTCHQCGIIHSDLKPENVVLNGNEVRLIDFGCASFTGETVYQTVQSLYYRAPEVIFQKGFGSSIDVWSFGCLLFEMVTGQPLFLVRNEGELISQIKRILGDPSYEMIQQSNKMRRYWFRKQLIRDTTGSLKRSFIGSYVRNSNKEIIDLISSCLTWDPKERPSMREILDSPFFN